MDRLEVAEVAERLWEERVRMAVIGRDVGRRPEDDQHSVAVDVQVVEHARIGLEVREVVLLLQARVAEQLGWPDTETLEPLCGNRVRNDHLRGRAHPEVVLEHGELVVVRRCTRDAEPARAHRQLVGAVGEREVELPGSRPAAS